MANGVDQRRFSREYKLGVIERMAAGEAVSALSRELGIARKCLYQWRDRYRIGGAIALRSRGRMTKAEAAAVRDDSAVLPQAGSAPPRAPPDELKRARARIAELERKVGQQELDLDFFKESCGTSRKRSSRAARLAGQRLRGHRSDDGVPAARRRGGIDDRTLVPARRNEPGRLLPAVAGIGTAP
jgi:transposase